MWRESSNETNGFQGSIGRFESSRSWFTISLQSPWLSLQFRRRRTMTKTCEKTRSEDGADLTSAIREYEKLRQHTARVSKPPWRRSKGRHGTLIGPVANGAEAHSLLTAEPTSPNNPTHPHDSARDHCMESMDGRACGSRAYCHVRLRRSPYGGLNEIKRNNIPKVHTWATSPSNHTSENLSA